jgi:hypothetical protein
LADSEGRTSVRRIWVAGAAAGASVHTIISAGDGARLTINIISGHRGGRHVDHDVLARWSHPRGNAFGLEEPDDLTVFVEINLLVRRVAG